MLFAHRHHVLHLFASMSLVSILLLLLTFLTASSLASAPNARIVKKLNLNDRLTVKGKACQPQVQSQVDTKIVIRCLKNKAQSAEPNTRNAKITLVLNGGDKLIVKRSACRLQVTSLSNTRVWIICDSGPLPPIVPDTTKTLTSDTTQYLESVSQDGATFTFSQATTELSALQTGDVMVSNPTQAAPDGFLRKVDSIQNNGGQIVVQTEATTIADAVQQGEISIHQVLTPTSLERATFAEGVTMVRRPDAPNSFYLQLNNVVLYDEDGNPNTTNDQVNGNGSISLDPRYDFRLKVENFQLKELYFTTTAGETSQLKIGSKVFVTVHAVEKTLVTYPLGPLFFTIGPFPVTVYPVITITAGIDGTIQANVSTGVTQSLTETAGVSYANNAWNPIQQFTNQFEYDPPTLSAGLSIKGYTGAKLKILFYGSVGPDIALNAYLKLEADPLQTPWWKLYGGLEVPVGISIDVFSHVVAGWNAVVIDFRIVITRAQTPPPSDTVRVSIASDGTQGNEYSYDPAAISADGRYVAFSSDASNLVNGDTNGAEDIFLHDIQTKHTSRVSIASDGTQAGGPGYSSNPTISADGRYVAFESNAKNLVSGDSNSSPDIFVHDMQTGQTARISVNSDGSEGAGWSIAPAISADGRYVAFWSGASNLVSGDTNGSSDVFLHDIETGQTTRVSVSSDGTQSNDGGYSPVISDDGRFVAFVSWANDLVSGDTNGSDDVFLHDNQTGQTTRVSLASDGIQGNSDSGYHGLSLSADGHYVAFQSDASNLAGNDTNGKTDIFVHDTQTKQTTRVSLAAIGTQSNGDSSSPFISLDGRFVAFGSNATNLVSGDTNGTGDIFVYDRQTGKTSRVSVSANGAQGNGGSYGPSISADGRLVAFGSYATNLVNSDTNGFDDVFVRQRW